MIGSHDSKSSPQNQDVRIKTEPTPAHTLRTPTPRTYNGKKYYCASDVAKIIGVDRTRVVRWNNELWHGAQWFTADLKTHDGVYLYEIERVMQLASVYHPKWSRGSYEPSQGTSQKAEKFSSARTILENLPDDLLNQKRFFPVKLEVDKKGNLVKRPCIKAWQKPENQMFAHDAIKKTGLIGMDICGHGLNPDFFFVDFDNVKDQSGNFIFDDAERWFNYLETAETFSERSIRKCGLHFLLRPTPNLFPELKGENGRHAIYFDKKNKAKIELFYRSGRYILLTGDGAPNTVIESGEVADEFCQYLCSQLALDTSHIKDKNTADACAGVQIDSDISVEEVKKMLAVIDCSKVSYFDWFKTGAILYYHFGEAGFELWRAWSETDPERYTLDACQKQWGYIVKSSKRGIVRPAKIGSLIFFAKKFGYKPPRRADLRRVQRTDEILDADDDFTTQTFVKDCPIALTLPSNFEFNNSGITQLIPDKKKTKRLIATRTPIVPTKILREAKSGTVQYEIEIKSGKKWRKAIVSGRTINDTRSILDLAEYGALIESPAALKSFFNSVIALNLDNGQLPSVKVYKMPGWHDGEFIYPQSSGEKIVMRDGIDYDSIFDVRGTQDTWKNKFEEVCWGKGLPSLVETDILLIKFIVSCALLAPALEVLGLPNTQVHIWGSRNFAKSPILKLAVSIFGNPTEGKLFRNFASTTKNRMTFSAGLCDLPLAIDELEAADKFDDLQGDIYKYFGGTINQANKRDGRTREAEDFRGVRLMTGEHALIELDTAKGGALKRLIQLQAKTPLMSEDRAHELHLFLADNYGHYGRAWTQYITGHKAEIKERFAKLKDKLANDNDAPNCEKTHSRTVLAAFFCFSVFSIMTGTAPKTVCMDDDWILTRTRLILRELPTLDEMDTAKRAVNYLSSYVVEHPRKFIADSATYQSADERERKADELDGIIYFDGKVAFFANAFARVISKSGLPSYSSVLAELYEAGHLVAKNSREKSIRVKHPTAQNRVRVYLFKEGVLLSSSAENSAEREEYGI